MWRRTSQIDDPPFCPASSSGEPSEDTLSLPRVYPDGAHSLNWANFSCYFLWSSLVHDDIFFPFFSWRSVLRCPIWDKTMSMAMKWNVMASRIKIVVVHSSLSPVLRQKRSPEKKTGRVLRGETSTAYRIRRRARASTRCRVNMTMKIYRRRNRSRNGAIRRFICRRKSLNSSRFPAFLSGASATSPFRNPIRAISFVHCHLWSVTY